MKITTKVMEEGETSPEITEAVMVLVVTILTITSHHQAVETSPLTLKTIGWEEAITIDSKSPNTSRRKEMRQVDKSIITTMGTLTHKPNSRLTTRETISINKVITLEEGEIPFSNKIREVAAEVTKVTANPLITMKTRLMHKYCLH